MLDVSGGLQNISFQHMLGQFTSALILETVLCHTICMDSLLPTPGILTNASVLYVKLDPVVLYGMSDQGWCMKIVS